MARCSGSGQRRLTLFAASLIWVAADAQTPQASTVASPAQIASTPVSAQKGNSKKVDKTVEQENPSAGVLEYLGQYGDAADGLDPLGLAEPEDTVAAGGDAKKGGS